MYFIVFRFNSFPAKAFHKFLNVILKSTVSHWTWKFCMKKKKISKETNSCLVGLRAHQHHQLGHTPACLVASMDPADMSTAAFASPILYQFLTLPPKGLVVAQYLPSATIVISRMLINNSRQIRSVWWEVWVGPLLVVVGPPLALRRAAAASRGRTIRKWNGNKQLTKITIVNCRALDLSAEILRFLLKSASF